MGAFIKYLFAGLLIIVACLFAFVDPPVSKRIISPDPTVEEIGWREVVSMELEPLSGAFYYVVSLDNNTNNWTSFRYCFADTYGDGNGGMYSRGNEVTHKLEVYVFARNFKTSRDPVFFAMKGARILRADK